MKPGPIRLIGVASGIGAPDRGCEKGPWALKHSHWMHPLAGATEWSDLIYPHEALEGWAQLADLAKRIGEEVERALAAGAFPVVVGGDHTCAMGTWPAVRRALGGPLGLIWIDAHMDSHIPETSTSHAAHGMPLAALLGRGHAARAALADRTPVLRPEHACLLGVRSYEEEEAALLARLEVRVISQAEVQARGIQPTLAEALERVTAGTAGFGISLDLDAIDPREAPGVGTPAPDGLAAQAFLAALPPLLADPRLMALEIAEYNPEHDRAQATLQIMVGLLERLAKGRG